MSCNMSYIVDMATEASEMAHSNITEASEKLKTEAKKIQQKRDKLEKEKKQWEDNKKMLEEKSAFGPNVTLDVGGTRYKVSRATLTRKVPRSHMLSCMFSGLYPPDEKEEGGVFFIDRNGKAFAQQKYVCIHQVIRLTTVTLEKHYTDAVMSCRHVYDFDIGMS